MAEIPTLDRCSHPKEPDQAKDNANGEAMYAIIDYGDSYVQPIILAAIHSLLPASRLRLLPPSASPTDVPPGAKLLQIRAYEALDFAHAMAHPAASLVNSYVIRKALVRKHFLSATVDHWVAKHPASVLRSHVKRGEAFEVDYAEFLEDALVEAFDLRASLARNEAASAASREWWILKPSMADRGQGIRLFSTMAQLQGIFDGWETGLEADSDSNDDSEADGDESGTVAVGEEKPRGTHITASDLRYFVAQPYIDRPLLLPSCGRRKFHVRAYVLCVGAMRVYVCREMLALFAARTYAPPWDGGGGGGGTDKDRDRDQQQAYLEAHLTNSCLLLSPRGTASAAAAAVQPFWDLAAAEFPPAAKAAVFAQIGAITGDTFEAAAREMPVHFQPLPWAFEVFGLDFLVDAQHRAWLLEVNAFPDFQQTGEALRERVVARFWKEVVRLAVAPWAGAEKADGGEEDGDMVLVRSVDLGRR